MRVIQWILIGLLILTNSLMLLPLLPDQINQGWATLLGTLSGAVIGFSAIAWQTRQGFDNLIKSQENNAELTRKAMREQAELDRDAREHQAALERDRADQQRQESKETLANSLLAEISRINHGVSQRVKSLESQIEIYKKFQTLLPRPGFQMEPFKSPIFEANIKEIGLLGSSLAGDVITIYNMASRSVSKEQTSSFNVDQLIDLLSIYIPYFEELDNDSMHVQKRLLAFLGNGDDPGPLLLEKLRRQEEAQSQHSSPPTDPIP